MSDDGKPDEATSETGFDGMDEGELTVADGNNGIQLEKADRSLFELSHWYKRGKIVIDPEWQRNYVWDKKRASKLIESFLISLPVPVVYLSVNKDGKYEVIDGLQRLTSVFEYFADKVALVGLELLTDLNGKKFSQLPQVHQDKLEASILRTFEISQSTPKDLMFIIFERLNTGGVALNEMEIRNCLYRGTLNDLIKKVSQDPNFKQAINQKGIDRRMLDRSLVLRFLAFYKLTYKNARKGLKSFFNSFFGDYRNPSDQQLKEFREAFIDSQKAAFTIFGADAYRLRKNHAKGGGEWMPRANAAVFQVLSVSFTEYDLGQLTRAADQIAEAYLDLVSTDPQWLNSVSVATGDYARLEYAFVTWEARLKLAVAGAKPNDKKRLFTRQLKRELYEADSTCAICGQHIVSIHDMALDHHVHYWKGGLTVPSNARATHRQCNLERSHTTES